MSSPPGGTSPRPVRGLGPVIVVVLIFIAALLGYYQIVYYPPNHTSTTTQFIPPDPHNVTVTIVSGAASDCSPNCVGKTYVPDTITVVIGYNATVYWKNADANVHTVTAQTNDSLLDPRFTTFGPTSPASAWNNIPSGGSVNFTFIKPGVYTYFCSYHSWMVGQVIVKGGSNSSSSTAGALTTSSIIAAYHIYSLPRIAFDNALHSIGIVTLKISYLGVAMLQAFETPMEYQSIAPPMRN
jgi:plastocyanin